MGSPQENRCEKERLLDRDEGEWLKVVQLAERLARRLCPSNTHIQQDLVGEAIVMLFDDDIRLVRRYDPDQGTMFSTYIYSHLRYKMLHTLHLRYKMSAVIPECPTSHSPTCISSPSDKYAIAQEFRQISQIAIRMLRPDHATAWVLSEYNGASGEEMSRAFGASSKTVLQWKHRAQERLIEIVTVLWQFEGVLAEEASRSTGYTINNINEWREGYLILKPYATGTSALKQICEVTGVSEATVKKWIDRADGVNERLKAVRERLHGIRVSLQDPDL